MISVELELKYSDREHRPACAVLLEGDDPRVWLEVLTRENVQPAVELFPLPVSRNDLRVRGVVVRYRKSETIPRSIPGPRYGIVSDTLLVPTNAVFSPSIEESEWRTLFPDSRRTSVWHPQIGLIAFEPHEILKIEDLISCVLPEVDDWSAAAEGIALNSRLFTLRAVLPEDPKQMLAEGADGIGGQGGDIESLTKNLPQSGSGLGTALGGIAKFSAHMLIAPLAMGGKILSGLGMQGLQNWTGKLLEQSSRLFDARIRSIERLMQMLQESPDKGLEYAIPFGGADAVSPAAAPGANLSHRSVDFSLGNLFGSRSTDYWDIPNNFQIELLKKYRELAEREVHLGRHRRAAYIYAELLGDLNSAVRVLIAGKHYREAAVLYRVKLKRPLDAAQCLESGGLLQEAIELYDELGEHEKVGDLYRKLEDPAAAQLAYQRAVDVVLDKNLFLQAATLIDAKLNDPTRALIVLEAGWANETPQVTECLERSFEILGRMARHDEALKLAGGFAYHSCSKPRALSVSQALLTTAKHYPVDAVRETAADSVRVLSGRMIASAPETAPSLLRIVEQLTRQDRLLLRDTARFLAPQRRPLSGKTIRPGSQSITAEKEFEVALPDERGKLRSSFPIDSTIRWESCFATSQHIFACGIVPAKNVIVAAIGAWSGIDGRPQFNMQGIGYALPGDRRLDTKFAVDERNNRVFATNGRSVVIPVPESQQSMAWGISEFFGEDTVSFACEGGILWTIDSSLALTAFNRSGVPLVSRQLEPPPTWDPAAEIPILARESAVYLALGSTLIQFNRTGQLRQFDFGKPIRKLAGSSIGTLSRIAVCFDFGAAVCWPYRDEVNHSTPLSNDLVCPDACFLRNGDLLVWTDREWHLYSTQHRKLTHLGEIQGVDAAELSAVLVHPQQNRFVTATRSGRFIGYRLGKE